MRRAILVLAVMLGACGDEGVIQPGEACDPYASEHLCSDDQTAVFCFFNEGSNVDGTAQRYKCKGALGCTGDGISVVCDQRSVALGDACFRHHEGRLACAYDAAQVLVECDGERWVREGDLGADCDTKCVRAGDVDGDATCL